MKNLFVMVFFLLSTIYANAISVEESKQIAKGAQLYDKWMSVKGVKSPKEVHPSYPATGKKAKDSWRCKECHGWDAKGVLGQYSKGSHYTGIKGLQDYKNGKIEDIVTILKSENHQYGSVMKDEELKAIAIFVSMMQTDTPFIDSKTKRVSGDATNGGIIFQATCAKCHGEDGKMINFKEAPKEVFVGDAIRDNPWEAFHKIRFGHPGTFMPAFFPFGDKTVADILSYSQDLE
ncbi:MAG: hypothetical protein C0625_07490 [Arcobacter sp.]|nr:MAG: hypothetical protein C0625_07490 [Arcobacter sp.]